MTSIFILQAKTAMMERKRQNVIAEHKYGIIWIQSTAVFYNSLTEMYVYQGNGHIPFYVSSVSWVAINQQRVYGWRNFRGKSQSYIITLRITLGRTEVLTYITIIKPEPSLKGINAHIYTNPFLRVRSLFLLNCLTRIHRISWKLQTNSLSDNTEKEMMATRQLITQDAQ